MELRNELKGFAAGIFIQAPDPYISAFLRQAYECPDRAHTAVDMGRFMFWQAWDVVGSGINMRYDFLTSEGLSGPVVRVMETAWSRQGMQPVLKSVLHEYAVVGNGFVLTNSAIVRPDNFGEPMARRLDRIEDPLRFFQTKWEAACVIATGALNTSWLPKEQFNRTIGALTAPTTK